MKKFYGKKFVATALAAIIAVSSISATVFADFPYEADELFMSEDIQDGDYVQITAGDEGIYEPSSEYDEVIGMTDNEVRNLYDEFLADRPEVVSEDQEMSQEVLDEFAQYAVERGAIEDTAVQKAAITKALVRSEFKVVVTGGKATRPQPHFLTTLYKIIHRIFLMMNIQHMRNKSSSQRNLILL